MNSTSYVLGDSSNQTHQSVPSNFTSFSHHGHGHDKSIMYLIAKVFYLNLTSLFAFVWLVTQLLFILLKLGFVLT